MDPIVTPQGTQQNLFLSVFDKDMSKAEKERGTTLAANALVEWKKKAWDWLDKLPVGSEFTADDLVSAVGLPTHEDGRPNNNGVGGFISGLAKVGAVRCVGYTNSDRVTNHARVLRIWRKVSYFDLEL